jgi:DNA polymerase-3 subunit delta'
MAKKTKSTKAAGATFADQVREEPPPPVTRMHAAPVALSSILGQPHALDILRKSLLADRVHHAWIFHGPRGVGKFTAALAFAALLLDPTTAPGLTGDLAPDPESRVARLLAAGTHPDLHVITKELARYSDDAQVRDKKLITIPKEVVEEYLVVPAKLAPNLPSDARVAKVFIVDEAELMDRSLSHAPTQNSILKTLEEPDGKTVIILVTSSPDRLLTTIRSRSQQVRFGPLDATSMKQWVLKQDTSTWNADRDHLAWLIDQAEGSPGELLSALSMGLYAWYQTLTPMLRDAARGKYTLAMGPTFKSLIAEYAEAVEKADKTASKDAANRAAAARIFRMISRFYRDQLRSGLPRNVDASYHDAACRAIDAVRQAERLIDAQVNLEFVGEWLSAELVAAAEPVGV